MAPLLRVDEARILGAIPINQLFEGLELVELDPKSGSTLQRSARAETEDNSSVGIVCN